MGDHTLLEIHVKGSPELAARAADDLMNAAQMKGYVVRVNEAIQGIQQGDGWFAIDYGDKDRVLAEADIDKLIADVNGGECLKIEESGKLGSN